MNIVYADIKDIDVLIAVIRAFEETIKYKANNGDYYGLAGICETRDRLERSLNEWRCPEVTEEEAEVPAYA